MRDGCEKVWSVWIEERDSSQATNLYLAATGSTQVRMQRGTRSNVSIMTRIRQIENGRERHRRKGTW